MRIHMAVLLASFTGAPAWAQTPPAPSPQTPVDNGPNTPAANSAYQGGGVVLQGAPGAPAPKPQATAPGKTPQQMVPPGQ